MNRLPTYLRPFIGPKTYQIAHTYSVLSNGDCFFDSIRVILKSLGINKTIQDWRGIVARPMITQEDPLAQNTLTEWLELYQGAFRAHDKELLREFQHLRGLETAKMPLNLSQKNLLYQQMTQTNPPLYWGDQHAMRIIEEYTGLRFLVISDLTTDSRSPKVTPSLYWYHSCGYSPRAYAILYQPSQHYQPVSLQCPSSIFSLHDTTSHFVFSWDDLPLDFRRFMSQGYTH
jgi:hypothetical protein